MKNVKLEQLAHFTFFIPILHFLKTGTQLPL